MEQAKGEQTETATSPKKVKRPSPITPLRPFLKRRRGSLVFSVAMHVAATLMGLVPYWIIYRICDGLLEGSLRQDTSMLMTLALIAVASIALKGVLTAIATDWTHHAAYHVVYEVRMALADKLVRLPLGYFDHNDSGSIKHTVNESVEELEEGIAHLVPDITSSAALPLLSFVIMFSLDWRLSLAVVGFLVLTIGGYSVVIRRLQPIQAGFGKVGAAVSGAILTYVYGMKVIRAFSRTEQSFATYEQAVRAFSEVSSDIEGRSVPFKTTAVLLSRSALLIVVPVGLWLMSSGQLTAASLVFFVLMSMGIGAALFKLLRSGGMTAFRLAAAMKRVGQLLQEQEIKQGQQADSPVEPSIRLRNVDFGYGDQLVLKQVSLEIPAGSFTALVGPSGAGKTSIARLIPRFWDVNSGSVEIGGVDVRTMSEQALLSQVSFVFQDAYLFSGSVMDNIRLGRPEASDDEVIAAAKRAACHDFIAALPNGYETEVGEGGVALSGGERQRISLVRAILKDAPIIVLDEATALVDPGNEARIQDALIGLTQAEHGKAKTVVAIAHRLGTIVHADQIIVLEEGCTTGVGTHEHLLAHHTRYSQMWHAYEAGSDDVTSIAATTDERMEDDTATASIPHIIRESAAAIGSQQAGDKQLQDTQEQADPFRHLKQMSSYAHSILLADQKQNKMRGVYVLTIFENIFTALGLLALIVAVYASLSYNMDQAWQAYVWMLVAFCGQGIFYYWTNKWSFPLFGDFLTRIRLYLGRRLARVSYGFFLEKEASLLESRIKGDAATYIFMPSSIVLGLLKVFVIPPLLLIAMFVLDWRLALISLVGVPFSMLITWLSERKLKQVMARLGETRRQANSRILEYIRGIMVIRAYALTGSRMRNYQQTIEDYKEASIAINRKLTPYTAIYQIAFELGLVAVLVAGGFMVGQATLDPVVFVAFLVLSVCFYEPLPLMDYTIFRRLFLMTIDHMNDIIQSDDLKTLPNHAVQQVGHRIEMKQVTFGYGERAVLRHLNLTIPDKGMTALVGPSGGGKTTILHLIARFWEAEQGSIMIGGRDIRSIDSDECMKQLALVFQDVYLFNDTIANNIRLGRPDASMEEVREAARKARCTAFIENLPNGYDTMVGEGGGLLSGGQKQRLSIARAILKDAPIILLDEATSSVDPDNERYILEAMEELAANKTVITIAHRLHTVRHADQIIVIDQGQVAQCGKHEQLLAQPGIYRHFWEERRRAQDWKLKR